MLYYCFMNWGHFVTSACMLQSEGKFCFVDQSEPCLTMFNILNHGQYLIFFLSCRTTLVAVQGHMQLQVRTFIGPITTMKNVPWSSWIEKSSFCCSAVYELLDFLSSVCLNFAKHCDCLFSSALGAILDEKQKCSFVFLYSHNDRIRFTFQWFQ